MSCLLFLERRGRVGACVLSAALSPPQRTCTMQPVWCDYSVLNASSNSVSYEIPLTCRAHHLLQESALRESISSLYPQSSVVCAKAGRKHRESISTLLIWRSALSNPSKSTSSMAFPEKLRELDFAAVSPWLSVFAHLPCRLEGVARGCRAWYCCRQKIKIPTAKIGVLKRIPSSAPHFTGAQKPRAT